MAINICDGPPPVDEKAVAGARRRQIDVTADGIFTLREADGTLVASVERSELDELADAIVHYSGVGAPLALFKLAIGVVALGASRVAQDALRPAGVC